MTDTETNWLFYAVLVGTAGAVMAVFPFCFAASDKDMAEANERIDRQGTQIARLDDRLDELEGPDD